MKKNVRLYMGLGGFLLCGNVKQKKRRLFRQGFCLEIIPADGDFREYVRYVTENKVLLLAEYGYIKESLEGGDSWGEVLIIKNNVGQIVGSFGPNRTKIEEGGIRAMPGYFFVLPKWRGLGIGTTLWNIGVKRMKETGAQFIRCSVEPDNNVALKIYRQMGMKVLTPA